MATILRLTFPRRASKPAPTFGHTAEIVLFPGVRYERWTDAVETAKTKRKRKPRARRSRAPVAV